ncbi:hypothetical protein C7212DRAFT_327328, partial [Tuber magnatum]
MLLKELPLFPSLRASDTPGILPGGFQQQRLLSFQRLRATNNENKARTNGQTERRENERMDKANGWVDERVNGRDKPGTNKRTNERT